MVVFPEISKPYDHAGKIIPNKNIDSARDVTGNRRFSNSSFGL